MLKIIFENILKDPRKIYVKGLEKKNLLRRFIRPSIKIIDMLDLKCPPLQQLMNDSYNSNQYFHD